MKLKSFYFLAIIFSTVFISCSKSAESSYGTIIGTWKGTRDIDNLPVREDLGVLSYSFELKEDSTISTTELHNDGGTYLYKGTWSLKGSAFSARINSGGLPTQLLSATYNSNGTMVSGRWVPENGSVTGGNFNVAKSK